MTRFEDADGHPVFPLTSYWKPGSGEVWKRRTGLSRGCASFSTRAAHRISRASEIAFEVEGRAWTEASTEALARCDGESPDSGRCVIRPLPSYVHVTESVRLAEACP